jgi:gas vesicle protein
MDNTNPRVGGSATYDEARPDAGTSTRKIRAEIEDTRDEMSETVNAIQDRLHPSNVAANAKEAVKSAALDSVRDVVESEPVQYLRENPWPIAMIALGAAGLAMLAFGDRARRTHAHRDSRVSRDWRTSPRFDRSEGSSPYGEYGTAGSSGRYAEHGQSGTRERTAMSDARDREWSASAKQAAYRADTQLRRTWNESPLLIGAASAVIGAIVGLSIPETDRENQLMGEARDTMVDSVQDTVREKVNQVQDAATSAVNSVKDAASSATGFSMDEGTNRIR